MAVRFVAGRAGSGKTRRCLEAIWAELRQSCAAGSRLLLIVPEQASFQMERALIETPDLAGFTRCEVLSFQRLAYRIFAETGADPRRGDQTIGSSGRTMVLRRLIRRERHRLVLLGRVADKPGLIRQVATALDELMRQEITPEQLGELAARDRPDRPLESAKLADLTRLYQSYLDYLLTDRLDPAQYLSLAADRIGQCACFEGARVWVDGFAGFTAQEYHLLAELARRAASVEITMLVDPHASALDSDAPPAWTQSLFARTERTVVQIRRELKARGLAIESPVRLPDTHFVPAELRQLERFFFSERDADPGSGPPADAVVCVNDVPDRRTEVMAAIDEIGRLTRERGMRYRDIAIIVRDLEPYHDLLQSLMRAHAIPCFIDRRQRTAHHPLIELLRGLLAIASDDGRFESLRLMLKTGLLPLTNEDADLLENYLLATGIEGWEAWRRPWRFTRAFRRGADGAVSPYAEAQIARVNQVRSNLMAVLSPWIEAAAGSTRGLARASSQYACLKTLRVPDQIHAWADAAETAGRPEEADAHRQVWSDFVELLDEFVAALGDDDLRIEEFRETLEAGLAEFSLGLAPPTLDQVLVGAIERSRHPNVRAALLLGFDESLFPRRRSEDPLLGDAEREALEDAGLDIGPSRRRQLLDERMLAYIALSRASERLWISYPRADTDGKPLQASPYLRDVRAALPGLVVTKMADSSSQRGPTLLTNVAELGARLARELRYRPALAAEDDPGVRGEWNSLFARAAAQPDWSVTLKRCLAGLGYVNVARLRTDVIARLVKDPFETSVSRLERFAACPFAHFAEFTLHLEPRVEADMADVDLGKLCHTVLERFVQRLVEEGESLAGLENDQIDERVAALTQETVERLADELMSSDPRNAYLLDRSRGHLARVARWQRDAARVGKFKPRCVEYPFGYSDDRRLMLKTPSGRTVYLRGRIDRVDVAELGGELLGLVVDYKRTTDRRLDLTQVYHGLALQLVGYLLALQQGGHTLTGRPIRPVAALYLPLLEPFKTVKRPGDEKKITYQMRGILDAGALPVIDDSLEAGGRSKYVSAFLKKDGAPGAKTDLAESGALRGTIAYVGRKMGELADEIIDGRIDIDPYRLNRKRPCTFCPYLSICRYEILLQPPRPLESMNRTDALGLLGGPPAPSSAAPPTGDSGTADAPSPPGGAAKKRGRKGGAA